MGVGGLGGVIVRREGFWEFLTVSVVKCISAQLDAVLHYTRETSPLQFMEYTESNIATMMLLKPKNYLYQAYSTCPNCPVQDTLEIMGGGGG